MAERSVRIGHFRLKKTLGIGSFGKVKLAVHEPTGRNVAIKILNRQKIKSLGMQEKVKREIKILKMFKHPHIIREYEVIDTPTDIFVVMEHVAGGELFDYIVQRGRVREAGVAGGSPLTPLVQLSEPEARRFFQQIISGVEYCHHHRVVHRDLKPENLLLDADENVKIADFGLANMTRDGEFLSTSCGSPNYAAPEVITGCMYAGPEVDVWSCGVILYALLCGSLPFDDESIPALFRKIRSGIYALPSHLSHRSRDLIPRMLMVDPMRRITIAEIREHPWFQTALPAYMALPPADKAEEEEEVDEAIVDTIMSLAIARGLPRPDMLDVLRRRDHNPFRVAYDLLHDKKMSQLRLAEQRLEEQQHGLQPVAFSPSSLDLSEQARAYALAHAPATTAAGGSLPVRSATTGVLRVRHKRRRWYLGIQSKKDPAVVMTEVFRALTALNFEWKALTPFCIRCRWRPPRLLAALEHTRLRAGLPSLGTGLVLRSDVEEAVANEERVSAASSAKQIERLLDQKTIKIGLQLYRVHADIFLLDFQRVAGDAFSFMMLCSHIIMELQVGLSGKHARSAAAAAHAAAAADAAENAGGQVNPAFGAVPYARSKSGSTTSPGSAGTVTPFGAAGTAPSGQHRPVAGAGGVALARGAPLAAAATSSAPPVPPAGGGYPPPATTRRSALTAQLARDKEQRQVAGDVPGEAVAAAAGHGSGARGGGANGGRDPHVAAEPASRDRAAAGGAGHGNGSAVSSASGTASAPPVAYYSARGGSGEEEPSKAHAHGGGGGGGGGEDAWQGAAVGSPGPHPHSAGAAAGYRHTESS